MKIKSYQKDGIPTVNPEDILSISSYQIIDVRMPEEFTGELGHIENAQLVTQGPELEIFLNKNNKTNPLIFVCRSGARSGKATLAAQQAGYSEVYNMDGGMLKWNALELPIKK